MLGKEALMRLSLVISSLPSGVLARGTLKSTRMKTRFLDRSRSRIERNGIRVSAGNTEGSMMRHSHRRCPGLIFPFVILAGARKREAPERKNFMQARMKDIPTINPEAMQAVLALGK